jgi:hypothetical protein
MEAGSHSGIARLVQQSLGTSVSFLYIYISCNPLERHIYLCCGCHLHAASHELDTCMLAASVVVTKMRTRHLDHGPGAIRFVATVSVYRCMYERFSAHKL